MTTGGGQPLIIPNDLAPFATIDPTKAQAMIDDAIATATLVAPCIATDNFAYRPQVKAILRGALLRWNDAGSGAVQTQTAGPFSNTLDTRQQRRAMFWPSEIEQLQKLCHDNRASGIFSVDTAPGTGGSGHMPWCNLIFGANYCSCGADINNGVALYEGGILSDGI